MLASFINPEFRTVLILVFLFTIPGWAILSVTGIWKLWPTLQRWCIAVGISIAFFPVIFYAARLLLPSFRIGANKVLFLLLSLLLLAIFFLRKNLKEQLSFDALEWLSIAVFIATVFIRLRAAYLNPYPAWTDSLHHTLLTQLTATTGRLPENLEPYAPTTLAMYHLGLYAITGIVQQIAEVPAHTALLWGSQMLNGLCGLGIYLVLDRKVGRMGALAGAVVVGLLSFQPAWYINWGRFTQVASQSILLIAWLVTWDTMRFWRVSLQPFSGERRILLGLTLSSAFLIASVFLLHYRVAYFFLPLLAIIFGMEFWQGYRSKNLKRFLIGTAAIAVLAILLTTPALFSALKAYYLYRTHPASLPVPEGMQSSPDDYFAFSMQNLFSIGLEPWLFTLTLLAMAFSLFRRNTLSYIITAWLGLLVLIGYSYLLNIPLLKITNIGAIAIMLYLPAGLLIGTAIEELRAYRWFQQPRVQNGFLAALMFAGFVASHVRAGDIHQARYFITAADASAMGWIQRNTPTEALFGINTYFWSSTFAHGSDAGFWIPYFTGRQTTTGTMLNTLGPEAYLQAKQRQSIIINDLKMNYQTTEPLCKEGIDYLYLGAKGDFTGKGLNAERLKEMATLKVVYEKGGVVIFQLNCP
jgi:hypothetical protein